MPNMQLDNILLYAFSFFAIWFGAGLIINAIHGVSEKLHLSSFSLSFFVLGILTSIPELAVGLTSVIQHDPQIFVGNLLGGIPVLFLFVIPLLAIIGNGIKLSHNLSQEMIFFILTIIAMPAAFTLDNHVTTVEAVVLILLYVLLFLFIEHKQPVMALKRNKKMLKQKSYSLADMLRLLLGAIIVFTSSRFIVSQTILFSEFFHISPFLVSLIVLSLGTNLPEISVGIRSVFTGDRDIALGDYLGSATANVLLMGGLTLINQGEVISVSNFTTIFLFIIAGIGLFYIFAKSNKKISRKEGVILLSLYFLFTIVELMRQ